MTKKSRVNNHYVVAIGASAGGLEAIHEFFDHMADSSSLSFIIIQHLSPDYKSLLVELVSRHTHMNVYEAEQGVRIRKNCIYVIPNNKLISVKAGKFILTEKPPLKTPNNAVDVFMHSLAKEKKSQAIAVILSGTGTDGTKGIAAIKEEGGLVIVQNPESSKFDGMPRSAINSGLADFILHPIDMPRQINDHLRETEWVDHDTIDDQTLQLIFEQLRIQSGFDFHYYKTPTIVRRVFHRMKKANFASVNDYYQFLKDNADECKLLGKEFLINVTRFFRDHEAFDLLKTQVFPRILQDKQPGDQLKIWICACSTGEEAYSIAILVDELLEQHNLQLGVKIFATDIERSNIEIASKGYYPKGIREDLSAERLEKYFTESEDGYTVKQRIRKEIVFAVHNVIKDPPFIKNDLVSCRNMMIYMGQELQQRVYSVLLFSVNRFGYIFLGPTENATAIRANLEEVSNKWKIFRKKSEAKLVPYLADVDRERSTNADVAVTSQDREEKRSNSLWDDFKDTVSTDLSFAAFYINRNFEIKEAVGNFDQILSLPKKILKLNLLRMLPSNVSSVLITEIKKVWKDNEKKHIGNLRFRKGDKEILVQAVVKPERLSPAKQYTLVVFQFMTLEQSIANEPVRIVYREPEENDYIISLEEELNETRRNLQYAVEDLQTTNEELQSSNEELLSANEELQSSNEELQSLNEELHTLNTEHQMKIKELVELNDDLNNYFRSSNIGQIFLDKNLHIRKFNPAAVRMVNLIDTDIGRPITHISTNIRYHSFIKDLERVAKTRETVEKEVQLFTGMNLLVRIMPYITQDQKTAGLIISFVDITTITNLNNIIRGVFNSSLNSILALEAVRDSKKKIVDFTLVTVNHAGEKLLGRDPENLKGTLLRKDINNPLFERLFQQFSDVIEKDVPLHTNVSHEDESGWFEVSAVKMSDGLVATFTDVTQKKTAEERLKKNYVELVSTKENLKKLNADLELKVTERTQLLSASEERFRLVARATNDAIWDWDLVNNRMWFSDAFYLKFGYDPGQQFTRKLWHNKIHPDDLKGILSSLEQTINSGTKQWTKEYRFLKADGTYASILDRGYLMHDEFNTPYRMLGSMMDLTDLRKAEQEIESHVAQRKFLAESMPLIVWTASADGSVDFVNKQFEVYTGTRNSEALGNGWKSVVHRDDLPRLERHWAESIEIRSDFQIEIRLKLFDGTYHWNILRAKARKDESGNVINWVITTFDIHEQKQLHELLEQKVEERTHELLKTNQELEMSNNDLQQFASVASHDLQEPLRKIHLFAQLVQDRYAGQIDGASMYLNKILTSSARMKSVISNILNYSRLSAENAGFVRTDINIIINEIIEDLEVFIEEKKAKIVVDRIPKVDAIAGQIRQVFQNIIGNSLKFARPNVPPLITISAETTSAKEFYGHHANEGEFCRITIKDNGIGFNEKFTETIFVLFHRLHSKDTYEGTGIGLAIAKKIIEKHNGIITASGADGEGAQFIIVLPIQHSNMK